MPWNLIGHHWAVDLLHHDLASGHLAHSYLITGADGIGKRTLALQFASALNCQAVVEPGDFCGTCRSCRLFLRQQHVDLSLLQPETASGTITVDAVRTLLHALTLKPLEARYRIALMQNIDRANNNASNALLKTIEEPPPSSILILTAETATSLLPTVISRCRIIALRPVGEQEILRALMDRKGLSADRALPLARRAGGRPGWAFSQLEDSHADETRQEWFGMWQSLFRQSRKERMDVAQEVAADRNQAITILRMWQAFSLDLLLYSISSDEKISNMDFVDAYRSLSALVPAEQTRIFLSTLRRAEDGLDRNANARLAVEAAVLLAPSVNAAQ
jgi:DNA polymerase III subunit delta'